MEKFAEVKIFPYMSKSFEDIKAAVHILENLLTEGIAFNSADYYKARNFVKSGESLFQEALMNARKVLGPLPEYASDEFIEWRSEILEKSHILAKNQEFDALKAELMDDEDMNRWLNPDEITLFLEKHFHSQKEGKRKLVNIKVRIILAKLQEYILQAKDLQKEAFAKQQSNL